MQLPAGVQAPPSLSAARACHPAHRPRNLWSKPRSFMTQNRYYEQRHLSWPFRGSYPVDHRLRDPQAKTPSLKPAEPMVQVIPPQGAHEPRVAEVPSRPEPIYINPVIDEVEMASYINDDGNLVFPGKVLVIREPGHWNLAGAQKNSKYYVPADNQPPQLAPPSKRILRLHPVQEERARDGPPGHQPRAGAGILPSKRSRKKPNQNSFRAKRPPTTLTWVGWPYRTTLKWRS